MKKVFAITIIGLALVSCKKSSSGIGTNGVQATIGGKGSNYTILTTAILKRYPLYVANDSGQEITIKADNSTNAANGSNTLSIVISIQSDTTLGTGVYSDSSSTILDPRGSYKHVNDFYYELYNNPFDMPSFYGNANVSTNPFTVTVTSISATSIQGTFQGSVYYDEDSTSFSQAATGKFVADITKQ